MKKQPLKQRGSTLFLRAALLGISALVAFFGSMMLVAIYNNWGVEANELAWLKWPVFISVLAVAVVFFAAGTQAWRLLNLFDRGKAFSREAVSALNYIKYCALAIGVVLAAFMPLVYYVAEQDDAPGVILFGLGFVAVPWSVAVFAGILQKILQNAINIKAENDLTV